MVGMSSGTGTDGTAQERCSACGASAAQAKKLFSGRAAGAEAAVICDGCVRECEEAIAAAPTRIPGGAHRCAYCAKPEEQVAVIVGIGPKKICDECVDAYRATLGA